LSMVSIMMWTWEIVRSVMRTWPGWKKR
jgi:hypothetical protein